VRARRDVVGRRWKLELENEARLAVLRQLAQIVAGREVDRCAFLSCGRARLVQKNPRASERADGRRSSERLIS
jgi:hypothetical protein